MLIDRIVEWLPVEWESVVFGWWGWKESGHKGLQAHNRPLGGTAHDLHVAKFKAAITGEQVLVLAPKQCSVLVQLKGSGLNRLRHWIITTCP